MKKTLAIISFILFIGALKAQNTFEFSNCNSVKASLALANDTIIIKCDSVYFLNNKTFAIYKIAYQRIKGQDVNIREAFNTYESLINLQKQHLDQKDLEYSALKAKFDSLAISSNQFAGNIEPRLTEIKTEIGNANQNLQTALGQIKDAQDALHKERKNKIKNYIAIGAGSFVLGLVVGML
jgi:hypothetical protein